MEEEEEMGGRAIPRQNFKLCP